MKKIFFALALAALLFSGCHKEKKHKGNGGGGGDEPGGGGGDEPTLVVRCVTGDANGISWKAAVLNGQLVSEDESIRLEEDLEPAFILSTRPEIDINIEQFNPKDIVPVDNIETDGSFSTELTGLTESTTYYFRAILMGWDAKTEKEYILKGDVKSFTTAAKPRDPSVTGAVLDTTEISAVLEAWATPQPEMGAVLGFGFFYSDYSIYNLFPGYSGTLTATEKDADGRYTVTINDLNPNTTYYYKAWMRTENNGYLYGEPSSFKTPDVRAEVLLTGLSDVSEYQFTLNGKLKTYTKARFDPDVQFHVRGSGQQYYSAQLAADSTFSAVIGNLTSGASYYCSAEAIVGGKIFKSQEIECVTRGITGTVELLPISNLTEFSATLGAKLSTDISPTITREAKIYWYGGEWNQQGDMVVDGNGDQWDPQSLIRSKGTEMPATIGTDGSFSINLSGLAYNHDYHYVAVATLAGYYECVSEVGLLHTPDIVVNLTTLPATELSVRGARMNGKITVQSVSEFSKTVWFKYAKGNNLSKETLINTPGGISVSEIAADGTFSYFWNLDTGTYYTYIACARVHDKEVYGEPVTFTTLDITGSISVLTPDPLYETSATLRGRLNLQGGSPTSVQFKYSSRYSTAADLKSGGSSCTATVAEDGSFSGGIDNLTPGTTYYCMARAIAGSKTFESEVASFNAATVSVEAYAPTNIKEKSATFNGHVTLSGPDDPGKYAHIYIVAADQTFSHDFDVAIAADGSVTGSYNSLKPAKDYYYQITAIVRDKVYNSSRIAFTTSDILVTPETLDATDIWYTYAILHGRLTVGDTDATELNPHFIYGHVGDAESDWESVDAELQSDGTYAARTPYLEPGTGYGFKFAVTALKRTVTGEQKNLTTQSPVKQAPSGALSLWTFATRDDGSQYEIFWADRNIDADSPQASGGFFSWGMLQEQSQYYLGDNPYLYLNWQVTKYCSSSTPSDWYSEAGNPPDNKVELDPEDDVAHARLGGDWRMPYRREFIALRECCNMTWIDTDVFKGVEVRSKSSSKTAVLYLCAAGDRTQSQNFWGQGTAGVSCHFWTRELNTGEASKAICARFYFDHFVKGPVMEDAYTYAYRYQGRNVRAVIE